jgi:L-2,4-diaminobutyrate transaminase
MLAVEFAAHPPSHPASRRRFDPALGVAQRIAKRAREHGLIARAMPHSDAIGFAPPLVLTRADAGEIVAIAASATRQVLDELTREGVFH